MANKFKKIVQWSEEDQLYIGSCPGLFHGGVCHGDSEEEIFKELCAIVEEEVSDWESGRETREKWKIPDPTPYFFDVERDQKEKLNLSARDFDLFKQKLEEAHGENPQLMNTLSFDKTWEEILKPTEDKK